MVVDYTDANENSIWVNGGVLSLISGSKNVIVWLISLVGGVPLILYYLKLKLNVFQTIQIRVVEYNHNFNFKE